MALIPVGTPIERCLPVRMWGALARVSIHDLCNEQRREGFQGASPPICVSARSDLLEHTPCTHCVPLFTQPRPGRLTVRRSVALCEQLADPCGARRFSSATFRPRRISAICATSSVTMASSTTPGSRASRPASASSGFKTSVMRYGRARAHVSRPPTAATLPAIHRQRNRCNLRTLDSPVAFSLVVATDCLPSAPLSSCLQIPAAFFTRHSSRLVSPAICGNQHHLPCLLHHHLMGCKVSPRAQGWC